MVCVQCFQDRPHVRASKRFCGAACKQAFHRARQSLRSRGLLDTPVCHWGRFQDYQAAYAGKIDVLITDPPYARATLPLYEALATLARTVLRPGGWLLCLTG
jgi:16S rRNA G966 N2-methylase RsmD